MEARKPQDFKKLELGGGEYPRPGFLSLDILPFTENTMEWNLENGLPILGQRGRNFCAIIPGTVEEIVADNVLEHITNLIKLMNDCHAVMKPGGRMIIVVPLAGTIGAWKDPTHVRHFVPESFDYFDTNWSYPRQPNYGILKWNVLAKAITEEEQDYRYINVILQKPSR